MTFVAMACARLAVVAMGVDKEILKGGKGSKPKKGQNVTVHCTGFGWTFLTLYSSDPQ